MNLEKLTRFLVLVTLLPFLVRAFDENEQGATITAHDEEYETEDEKEYEYETETQTQPPKGLLGQILMDGPDERLLPKNSTPEDVYSYLWKFGTDRINKEMEQVTPDLLEYFFMASDLVSQDCFNGLMRFLQRARETNPRAIQSEYSFLI